MTGRPPQPARSVGGTPETADSYRNHPALGVLCGYDNPTGSATRRAEFLQTVRPFLRGGVRLLVAEAVYGPGELPAGLPVVARVRGTPGPRQRERLWNLALRQLPATVPFVAWVEPGVRFTDPDWMSRTVDELRRGCGFVQPFRRVSTGVGRDAAGFAATAVADPAAAYRAHWPAQAGFAWAARAELLRPNGLYDRWMGGGVSLLQAHAMLGRPRSAAVRRMLGDGSAAHADFLTWAEPWVRAATRIGCVPGHVVHSGADERRGRDHGDPNDELLALGFDPTVDLRSTADGGWRFRPGRADLRAWGAARWGAPARFGRPGRTGPDSADPYQARVVADRSRLAGDRPTAQRIYRRLLAVNHQPGWCLLQLGRLAAGRGDWAGAVGWLDRALAADRPSPWAHLAKARALTAAGADPAAAVAELADFARHPPVDLGAAEFTALRAGAQTAWSAGRCDDAAVLLDLLLRRGRGGPRCRAQAAELALRRGHPRAALSLLGPARPAHRPDQLADPVRARAHLALGQPRAAAELVLPLLRRRPADVDLARSLVTAWQRIPDAGRLATADHLLRRLAAADGFPLRLQARLAAENYPAANRLLADHPEPARSAGPVVVADFVRELTVARRFAQLDRLLAGLAETVGGAAEVATAAAPALFAQKDWVGAERLLRAPLTDHPDDPGLRLRQLQLLCYTMRLADALAYVTAWGGLPAVPELASAAVAGLLAAVDRWSELVDFLRDRVARGFSVQNELLLDSVARAARQTGEYTTVVELLDRALASQPSRVTEHCRDRLLGELSLLRSIGAEVDGPSVASRIRHPFYAARAGRLAKALTAAATDSGCVYLCTDANYLPGTCVAVFSLLRNNPGLAAGRWIGVVCADPVVGLAGRALAQVAAAFSVRIHVLPASTMLEQGHRFQTNWGVFTPGLGLSDAAYYRLFTARWLAARGDGGRALYLDSDTCVSAGAGEFFGYDLAGRPLGARAELGRGEVRHAAVQLGIDPAEYFNSGVLLFDLTHPELADALGRAIDIALHQQQLLTFLDQCALNLAFQGRTTLLPPRFNTFVRQQDRRRPAVADPVVWHFLQRPKPWDPMYRTPNCLPWLREFSALAQVIRPETLREVMLTQFPAPRAVPVTPRSDSRTAASPVPASP